MADAVPSVLALDARFGPLARLSVRLAGLDLSRLLVYLVDLVEPDALPLLAEQFHVMGWEGFDLAGDDAAVRALIKSAIELHRYKGTPWAIRQALEKLALSGTVSEWFDYGGDPYHFKVDVDLASRGLGAADYDALEALIIEYKNVRSQLERLAVHLTNRSGTPSLGAVTLAAEIATVYPEQA